MNIQLTAVIITGAGRYEKPLHNGYMHTHIKNICAETCKQRDSEQWLEQAGFVKVKGE